MEEESLHHQLICLTCSVRAFEGWVKSVVAQVRGLQSGIQAELEASFEEERVRLQREVITTWKS